MITFSTDKKLFTAALVSYVAGVDGHRHQKIAQAFMAGSKQLPEHINGIKIDSKTQLATYRMYQDFFRSIRRNYQKELKQLFKAQLNLLGRRAPYKKIHIFADPFYEAGGYIIDIPGRKKWVVIGAAKGISWPLMAHEIFHLLLRKFINWKDFDFSKIDLPVSKPYRKESNKIKWEEYLVRAFTIILLTGKTEREKRIKNQVRFGFKLMPEFVEALSAGSK